MDEPMSEMWEAYWDTPREMNVPFREKLPPEVTATSPTAGFVDFERAQEFAVRIINGERMPRDLTEPERIQWERLAADIEKVDPDRPIAVVNE